MVLESRYLKFLSRPIGATLPLHALFISGFGHHGDSLQPFASALGLAPTSYFTSPYELLEQSQEISDSSYLESLLDLSDQREELVVVGWSMGAMLAIELADRLKERLKALVLIGGAARFPLAPSLGSQALTVQTLKDGIAAGSSKLGKMFFRSAYGGQLSRPELLERISTWEELNKDLLEHSLCYLERTDLTAQASKLSLPVMLIHGERDRVFPLSSGEALHHLVSQSELLVIKDGSHGCFTRFDRATIERIQVFIDGGRGDRER